MAILNGFTLYECDRCDNREYVAPGGKPSEHDYFTIRRIDVSDTEYRYVLCDTCKEDYDPVALAADNAFYSFMENN